MAGCIFPWLCCTGTVTLHQVTLTCVGALVPLELIRAGEALATEGPGADKRPLARVPAQVGAQVGRLAVDLVAAGNVADVLLLLAGVAPAGQRRQERECSERVSPTGRIRRLADRKLLTSLITRVQRCP